MATRLALYNAALRECGERKIASLSEDRAPRYILDDVWDSGFVDDVLNQGQWTFATRTVEAASDEDTEPQFGRSFAFVVPTDLVRTVALCEDERLQVPLTAYDKQAGFWYADIDPLYVSYVSSHADYGGDLSLWPPEFTRYCEAYLAWRVHPRMTGSKADRAEIGKGLKKARMEARSLDAMEKPTQFPPPGNWVLSRAGGRGSFRDRGSRSRLIG